MVGSVGKMNVALRDPTLWPHMLLPRRRRRRLPFPFAERGLSYAFFGRNAIYELVKALGLEGAEVLFPAYFHGVELEALIAAGARVRFFPVHAGMRVDASEIEALIGPATRAVYVIHYAGFPAPIRELARIREERGLRLIEDCALALLGAVDDRPLGSFGDASIFSLYKWLPIPDGGALLLRGADAAPPPPGVELPASARAFATLSLLANVGFRAGPTGGLAATAVRAVARRARRAKSSTFVSVGTMHFAEAELNYAMSRLSHRILRAQDFPSIADRRRRNYELLTDLLGPMAPPVTGPLRSGVVPLFYPIRIERKHDALQALRARGVEAVNLWEFHHPLLPAGVFPEVDDLRRTIVELPIHQDLSEQRIAKLADVVLETMAPSRPSLGRTTRPAPSRAETPLSANPFVGLERRRAPR